MTAAVESEDQFIKVVVGKLKSEKDDDSQKEHTFEINVTGEHTLEELWFTLEENGYSPPDRLKQIGDGRLRDRHDIKSAFYPHTEFEIVSDKSAADETHIYINESLHAATSRDQDVKFDVQYDGQGQTFLKIDDGLELVFHRTVRMPDDDRLHSLPASVGTFPLYNTEDYADRLPENILEKGGLFLPMWQREALWIGLVRPAKFRYKESMNRIYAIRVYVGQINALTGKNMMEERGSQRDQDYLIFPGQSWIDGICVAPGVVRQFVAMPFQDIVADHNPPQTWNINAARLINIHILDPVSCESVTHIVPPPIPMSAYEAILAKLPFFVVSEQIDNRLEGGDFDNVKSVSKMDETKGIASEPSLDPNQPIMCSSCEKRLCDCVYVTVS
ncbi:uncharacterized protein N7458_001637 [Penicillium daleae]|uniref:Ubiquitin-like domain-containing protein n=1 Tax=Penicillium daleae TaxID=63821 RepID=A0AAD6CDV9_9EURO|nr:uncharacterized protein N7458_001637 [Penicillium daleae]KAJ5460085.1 hypothetical protein N7458_001637 [Penicillium daleae]